MRRILATITILLAGITLAQQPVRVLTHTSFDLPVELLEQFTEQTGWPVELLPGGDAGEVVNRAVLTAGRPVADVLFGIDNSLLHRAAGAGVRLHLVRERGRSQRKRRPRGHNQSFLRHVLLLLERCHCRIRTTNS